MLLILDNDMCDCCKYFAIVRLVLFSAHDASLYLGMTLIVRGMTLIVRNRKVKVCEYRFSICKSFFDLQVVYDQYSRDFFFLLIL